MRFTVIAWLMTLLNTCVAAFILMRRSRQVALRRGSPRLGLSDTAVAAADVSMLALLEITAYVGRNIFGVIHLVYLHGVVLLPAVGLFVLLMARFRRRGRRWFAVTRSAQALAAISLLAVPVGVWASFIEPFRLQLEQVAVDLPAHRGPGPPIRVVVLADIQTDRVGAHEHHAIDLAMQQQPDIILLPGDLWQGDPNISPIDLTELKLLLNKLSAPGGVYFARGNCESGRPIQTYLEGTPVRLMTNEVVRIQVRDRLVTIAGVELDLTPAAAQVVQQLEADLADSDVRILMSHYPDHVRTLRPNSRIDLVVSGHTHGGQIAIPGYGPPVTLSHVPKSAAAGGLHVLDGNRLYVSRGVGWERAHAPRIRLFCPPEVALIHLHPAQ